MENEAVFAHRMVRSESQNSFVMSIDATKIGVVEEVWVVASDQFFAEVH